MNHQHQSFRAATVVRIFAVLCVGYFAVFCLALAARIYQ